MHSYGWHVSVAIAALGAPQLAIAQTPTTNVAEPQAVVAETVRSLTYDLAFFASFAPRTALDIARQVPGFQLDVGNADTRGFAGAAGNVVINGSRPSAKSESLETLLARIPAQRVVRVELGPGDLFGSDYAGKSQVLNVVMSTQTGLDANVTAAGRRLWDGYINRDLSGSIVFQRGPSTFNFSAGTGRNKQSEEGSDDLEFTSGAGFEYRRKFNTYFNRDPYLSASWAMERSTDSAFRANIRWQPSKFDLEQRNRVVPEVGDEHDDSLFQRYRNPVIEIGGDITQPLAGGAIKLVGLVTRRNRDNLEEYIARDGTLDDPGTGVVGGYEQTVVASRNETIGRLSWSRGDLFGLTFEAGVEGAYNTLDNVTELFLIGEGGVRTQVDLPIDQATVKEKRAEAYVSMGKNLSSTLRVDGGVNYEMSKLKVRGDSEADRSLSFLKPNIALDWRPDDGWHARISARRTVAQLNFYDFVSSAELSNDRVTAGNAELLPQRTWEFRASFDKSILGDGLIKLDLGHDRISMLQDQILTEDGFSAPGNIGTGKRSFAALSITAPLTRLGLNGVTLRAAGQIQRTRVHDPISDTVRNFSNFYPDWNWNVDLRRDAGAFSYGFAVSDRDRFTFFRANEIDTNWNGGPYATAFIEFRASPRSSITLDVDNLLNTNAYRERVFFDPNRSTVSPFLTELRERNRHLSFGLTFKQSFGGAAPLRVAESNTGS